MGAIEVTTVCKRYGTCQALDRISLDIQRGEIYGLIGPDGAGKTTLFRILVTLLLPDSGSARVEGLDVVKDFMAIRQHIGYMPGRFSLYQDLKVWENIRLFGGIYGLSGKRIREKSDAMLRYLNMTDLRDELVGDLPLGWKQKLAFSIALIHNPAIVFLDEPTGGVDPETRRLFWDLICEAAEGGTTIFVTTHYMDEAEYCDRVSIMVDGVIADLDTPAALKQRYGATDMDTVFRKLAYRAQRE